MNLVRDINGTWKTINYLYVYFGMALYETSFDLVRMWQILTGFSSL